jgi:hypothetical protein
METCPVPAGFDWYDRNARGALPPRSLFLQLLLLMLVAMAGLAVATLAGLVGPDGLGAVSLLAAALVGGGLVVDISYTLRRYRAWTREALCADCRSSFTRPAVAGGH